MDLATVNVIALLFGVVFITSLLIAAIKIVRSRHDAQSLGNRSVKVPLNDDSAVFDPTSSGLDEYDQNVTKTGEVTSETSVSDDAASDLEPVVAEQTDDSVTVSNDSEEEEIFAVADDGEDTDSEIEAENTEIESEPAIASGNTEAEVVSAEMEDTDDTVTETPLVVAEIAGEPIYASNVSDKEGDFQEIEVIENAEETQVLAEVADEEEPTGAISEGLIEEFLGTREPEMTEVEATEECEIAEQEAPLHEKVSEDVNEIEAEADASEDVATEIEASEDAATEIEVSEDIVAEVEVSEIEDPEIDEIEDYFDPEQPAFAARASISTSAPPLFKVAPLSVSNDAPEAVIADEFDVEETPSAEAPSLENTEPDEVDEPVTTATIESTAYDATVPISKIDIELDATVPITRPEQPVPDYSFEEVPEVEVIEDEVVLGMEITNQITQLDTDLDTIEELVREIELSLADFEPLSGFEDSEDEKAA